MNKNVIIAICFVVGAGIGFGGVKAFKAFTAPAEPPGEEIAQVVEPEDTMPQEKETVDSVPEEPAKPIVEEPVVKKEEEKKKEKEEKKKEEELKKPEPEPVGISADEVERRIMARDKTISGGGKDFASKVGISFTGLNDDDAPGNLSDVFSRLNLKIWSGVNVTKVGYDKKGKVNAITIQPLYPEE